MRLAFKHNKSDVVLLLKKKDSVAQKTFYEQNVGKFLSVSKAYVSDIFYAEDCTIKAFCKIFNQIENFRSEGSFDGWCRRIVVNECLNFIKTRKNLLFFDDTNQQFEEITEDDISDYDFNAQDLLDQLPEAYRMVFNLHILEDYSHQQIAELLNITVSTSKTQLFRAKQKLKDIYVNQKIRKNEI